MVSGTGTVVVDPLGPVGSEVGPPCIGLVTACLGFRSAHYLFITHNGTVTSHPVMGADCAAVLLANYNVPEDR